MIIKKLPIKPSAILFSTIFLVVVVNTILAPFAQANTWKERLGTTWETVEQSVKKVMTGKPKSDGSDNKKNKNNSAPLAEDLPLHWNLSFQREPIFESNVLVVETGDRDKPMLMLIHGLGQAGLKNWLNVIPALESDYHIIALDLPGFGYSDSPKGRYSPTNYAHIIHWLKQRYTDERVVVIGYSMGGAVALRYTSMYPGDIEKTVLVGAAGILDKTSFVKSGAEIPVDVSQLPKSLQSVVAGLKDISDTFVERFISGPDPTAILKGNDAAWNLMFSNLPNANAGLAMIDENFSQAVYDTSHQTSLIWGSEDTIAPLRTANVLYQNMPNAILEIIDGAGHAPMRTHTEAFNRLLLKILSSSPKLIPNTTDSESLGGAVDMEGIDDLETINEDVYCHNETGKYYQGVFKTITIKNCSAVVLKNVVAESIVIHDSVVTLENVNVTSLATALYVKDSVINATNVSLQGQLGILAHSSRLDFAGASITGISHSFRVNERSRLIFSISQLQSENFTGYYHGNYVLENKSR